MTPPGEVRWSSPWKPSMLIAVEPLRGHSKTGVEVKDQPWNTILHWIPAL